MKKLFLLVVVMFSIMGYVSANESYKLNDSQVDQMFNVASESATSVLDVNSLSPEMSSLVSVSSAESNNKVIIATVVCWFLGEFGIHRYILGTKGSMWAIYTFTVCGIFGIVPTVDFFVLLIDGIISGHGEKYENNDKFFMWAGK